MKNPPILISVLGFFGLMVGFYYIFAGLRILGFNFFGVFATAPVTTGWGFWGAMWIIVGLIYFGAAWALWTLQPWGWLFAVILSVFALISAFFVMFDAGLGPALGAALLPGIILLYLNTAEVKKAFAMDVTERRLTTHLRPRLDGRPDGRPSACPAPVAISRAQAAGPRAAP